MVLKKGMFWVTVLLLFCIGSIQSQSLSYTSFDGTPLFKSLVAKGYRVIVPDLRGNGSSDKPQEEKAYQANAEVKDLRGLIDALGIAKYSAIGYSRGSILLSKLLTMDDRIEKAVIGGMGLDFTNPNWDRRIAFAKAFDGHVTKETADAVDYAMRIKADFRSLHLQQKYQPVTTMVELSNLNVSSILVIAGDLDTDNGSPLELKEAIPNASLILVPGDHNTTYRTINFSKAVLQFIAH